MDLMVAGLLLILLLIPEIAVASPEIFFRQAPHLVGERGISVSPNNLGVKRNVFTFSMRAGLKHTVAILPLKGKNLSLNLWVYDNLLSEFINGGRFQVVERYVLDGLLEELRFSSSGLVKSDEELKIGKMIAADSVMAGTIVQKGSVTQILCRLIDSETLKIVSSHEVSATSLNLSGIKKQIKKLVKQFENDYPPVKGAVVQVNDEKVIFDIGKENGLRKNRKVLIFRPNTETEETSVKEAVFIGEARITEVHNEYSVGKVTRKVNPVKVMDSVVAK